MRKSNLIKKLLLVVNPIVVLFLILSLILKTKLIISLYWLSITLLFLLLLLLTIQIDKGNMDSDKKVNKNAKRSYSDNTTLATIFYGFIYLAVEFMDTLNSNFKANLYVICIFFFITILYEWFMKVSVDNAKKEIATFEKNKK